MERRGRKGGVLAPWVQDDRRPLFYSSKETKFFLRFGITQTTLGGLLYILWRISCIGRQRKSVKNYEHWLTLRKVIAIIQRVTFLLVRFVLPTV